MKEDDVDRDRRHESAEKQKSTKDLEKKKEKKKNLERQALEKRRAKSRQRGESEEESPNEDDGNDGEDDSDDFEGMAAHLDKILEGPPQADVDVPRTGAPKRASGGSHDDRQSLHRAALAPTPLLCLRRVGPFLSPNLLPHLGRATGSRLWRRGH